MKTPQTIRLTRKFEFEMAHALEGYDGPCRQIHGHSYKLFITVAGQPITDNNNPKLGMVMDFSDLKKLVNKLIIDRFDHALLLKINHNDAEMIETMRLKWSKIEITQYQPTCENLLIFMVEILKENLPPNVKLSQVKLYETERSYATWNDSDNI